MKKLVTIALMLLPLCLNGQILGEKHRLEVGAGVALPGEAMFEDDEGCEYKNTVDLYAGYRYSFTDNFSVGAVYTFVAPHKGQRTATYDDVEIPVERSVSSHSIEVFAEYKYITNSSVNFFVGLGGGEMYSYMVETYSPPAMDNTVTYDPVHVFTPGVSIYAGLELFNHLRITARHNHDLHYPITAFPHGFPYYCVNVGWAF